MSAARKCLFRSIVEDDDAKQVQVLLRKATDHLRKSPALRVGSIHHEIMSRGDSRRAYTAVLL